MTTWEKLLAIKEQRGAGYIILIDPDKQSAGESISLAKEAETEGADVIFVGGSLLSMPFFDKLIDELKENVTLPVVIFPGGVQQVSPRADAILFMSLISGRNPDFLIGRHVMSAPVIKATGLETIATGYMLIESGISTSAEFMSNTKPIPRDKTQIAIAHSLAAEFLGMKLLYLEAGSGARMPVPDEMISGVAKVCQSPLIVGGGIKSPDVARQKVAAGASFIVTGNVLEGNRRNGMIAEFAKAIHLK
ncbi:MAG: geranylgeranylglyceryl/heptaprenylglyceryl phosphate synthase [Calditrichaeota bacterium]|nr:geranylgeranylglyceryl/heptaprenylglyceryl phosphate synthase [Calditrichota bacterium]